MFVRAKNINQYFPSLVMYTKQLVDSDSSVLRILFCFLFPTLIILL